MRILTRVTVLLLMTLSTVRPTKPNQPGPTQPKFGPWGPNLTQLNQNLDPWGPTRPEIGFKLGRSCDAQDCKLGTSISIAVGSVSTGIAALLCPITFGATCIIAGVLGNQSQIH